MSDTPRKKLTLTGRSVPCQREAGTFTSAPASTMKTPTANRPSRQRESVDTIVESIGKSLGIGLDQMEDARAFALKLLG